MNKLSPFVLIGLPGVGKSTVSDAIIAGTSTEVVSTDKHFFNVRSNSQHPITKQFIHDLSEQLQQNIDASLLSNTSAFTEAYGMKCFRDLEEMILVDLISNTDFNGKILDLGGAAFDRENTRNAIKAKGITSIYLKADPELISTHLYKDFLEIKQSGQIRRGNYYKVALDAEQKNLDPRLALLEVSQKHLRERTASYSLADHILEITSENCTAEQTTSRVLMLLEQKQTLNQSARNATFRFQTPNEKASR